MGADPSRSRRSWHLVVLGALALAVAGCGPAAEGEGQGPRAAAWTLPAPGGWVVRWRDAAAVTVDGVAQPGGVGAASLSDTVAHTVQVDGRAWRVPPRPTDRCGALRLVVLGDGRATVDGVGPSAYWAGLLGEALALAPAAILNTGDLVKRGRAPAEWARYLRSLPPWPPVIAVRGNHDRGGLFERYGAGVGPVFPWDAGPVRVVFFDSEGEDAAVRARLPALAAALAGAGDRWRLVVLHRPVWSRGNHGSDDRGLNAALVPLLEGAGADLVLSGHDHDYERFCPSLGVGPARRCDPRGPLYVVSGGAATVTVPAPGLSRRVPDETARQDRAASQVFSGSHHLLVLDVSPTAIAGRALRTRTGNVRPAGEIDRFERIRPAPAACR